jgi:hypothetical protein
MARLLTHPGHRRRRLRSLLASEPPVLAPGCHDALSVRLVEQDLEQRSRRRLDRFARGRRS